MICTLNRSPNLNNYDHLFDHLSKSIDAITLQSPCSDIIILGDFNICNSDRLAYSLDTTYPVGHDPKAFAIVSNLTQRMSEPTHIPDRSRDKANTLDPFLTSNPKICSKSTINSPLGDSHHCLITLQQNILVSHQDMSFSTQKVFHFSKAEWDSLHTLYTSYPWYSGFSNDPSSFARFI